VHGKEPETGAGTGGFSVFKNEIKRMVKMEEKLLTKDLI